MRSCLNGEGGGAVRLRLYAKTGGGESPLTAIYQNWKGGGGGGGAVHLQLYQNWGGGGGGEGGAVGKLNEPIRHSHARIFY